MSSHITYHISRLPAMSLIAMLGPSWIFCTARNLFHNLLLASILCIQSSIAWLVYLQIHTYLYSLKVATATPVPTLPWAIASYAKTLLTFGLPTNTTLLPSTCSRMRIENNSTRHRLYKCLPMRRNSPFLFLFWRGGPSGRQPRASHQTTLKRYLKEINMFLMNLWAHNIILASMLRQLFSPWDAFKGVTSFPSLWTSLRCSMALHFYSILSYYFSSMST